MNFKKESKKLSIVIPSKNRFIYAKECIKSILLIENDDFELVIIDNSDGNELEDWIIHLRNDSRLKYVRKKGYLSVTENFQIGIDAASGMYVCTIGDDDGINPEIIDLIDWAIKNNIDAITPKFIADYTWPDLLQAKFNDSKDVFSTGRLKIKKFYCKKKTYNPNLGMKKIAMTCGMDLADSFYIPKIYYGVIKRDILLLVKRKIGTNFPGISPDLSGAIAAANFVNSYYIIDYPLFISGSSLKSTAGASNMKQHHGSLEEQKHITPSSILNWPPKIPKFYSVEAVWSQSALETLKALHRNDLLAKFNYSKIYASSIMFNSRYYKHVIIAFRQKNQFGVNNQFIDFLKFFVEYIGLIGRRGRYLIKNVFNKIFNRTTTIDDLTSVHDANLALAQFLKENQYSIQQVLSND